MGNEPQIDTISGQHKEPTPLPVPAAQSTAVDLFHGGPREKIAFATEIANCLSDVIENQKLYQIIKNKKTGEEMKYVKVDGWVTLGNLLSILPKEREVIQLQDGSFKATVDLINVKTGKVICSGSSICGSDENRWKDKPMFARRSMAVTRATGKAYRTSFGWIVTLAGYDSTPAEEMDHLINTQRPAQKQQPNLYRGTDDQKHFMKSLFVSLNIPRDKWKNYASQCIGIPMNELQSLIQQQVMADQVDLGEVFDAETVEPDTFTQDDLL